MVPLYGHYRTRLHSLGGQQVRGLDSVQELVEFKLERDTETERQMDRERHGQKMWWQRRSSFVTLSLCSVTWGGTYTDQL